MSGDSAYVEIQAIALGKARERGIRNETVKPFKEVPPVQVRPGQSRSGRAGSECCLSSGDRRVEAYTARKQAVRIQLRNRFIIATPTPLAWRKAASGKPIMRGCPGSPESLARGMLSRGLPVNPGELPISHEQGTGSAQPKKNQVPRETRVSHGKRTDPRRGVPAAKGDRRWQGWVGSSRMTP